jgi:hypothetical protein
VIVESQHEHLFASLDARVQADILALEETLYRELGVRDERIAAAHQMLLDEALKLDALRADVEAGRLHGEQVDAALAALDDRVTGIERDKLVADSAIELLRASVTSGERRTSAIETAREHEIPLTFTRLVIGFLGALAVFAIVLILIYVVIG